QGSAGRGGTRPRRGSEPRTGGAHRVARTRGRTVRRLTGGTRRAPLLSFRFHPVRRKSMKRVRGGAPGGAARPDPCRLLEAESGLVGRITAYLLSRYRLAPGETRALRRLVRARLLADDYRLLREFSGRSSFATYLTVVVVRLVRELTDGWRVPRPLAAEGDVDDEAAPPRPGVTITLAFLRKLP